MCLVVVFDLQFSFSIVLSGGSFGVIIQLQYYVSGGSFCVIVQFQYCGFWWIFLHYNSASVLCFLFFCVLLFRFSIVFSGGSL